MIDDLLDDLFETLFPEGAEPLVASRMALKPDPAAASHFVAPPRPRMTRDDMARIGESGLMAEVGRVLDDLPAGRRAEVLGKIQAIVEALSAEAAEGSSAEPPSLIYALH